MSEYGEGAVRLLDVMGIDAETAVSDLIDKLRLVEEFANGRVEELHKELIKLKSDHKEHLAEIDDLVSEGTVKVKCRSCDDYYVLDYEISLFDKDQSYCGKNEWCCP